MQRTAARRSTRSLWRDAFAGRPLTKSQARRHLHRLALGVLAVVDEDSDKSLVLSTEDLNDGIGGAVGQAIEVDLREDLLLVLGRRHRRRRVVT